MYILAKARSDKILARINDTSKTLPKVEVTDPTLEKITLVTKIKVRMIDWFGGADNKPDWFVHRENAEITYKQIQELHEAGFSIMLKRPDKNGICVLAISDSGF